MKTAVDFFVEHAGYSYDPKTQTPEEGKLACAKALADAEAWLHSQYEYSVQWVEDRDVDRSGIDHNGPLWGCIVTVDGRDESLWGIDLGENGARDPYRRVVESELAAELKGGA